MGWKEGSWAKTCTATWTWGIYEWWHYEPEFIGEVELKAGDTIHLSEVGPDFGFDGGKMQIDLQQQWSGDFTELGKIEDWR